MTENPFKDGQVWAFQDRVLGSRSYTNGDTGEIGWEAWTRNGSFDTEDVSSGVVRLIHDEGILDSTADSENPFTEQVWAVLDRIGNLLIEKNEAYGNSALNPIRIFSKADTLEQLRVRIDDKLNRLAKGHEYPSEDTVDDLLGYLVLYKIGERNV